MEMYSSSSGAMMFIPKHVEKTVPRMASRLSNDNRNQEDEKEEDKLLS